MASSRDCKEFLIDYLNTHPDHYREIFKGNDISKAVNSISKWKRMFRLSGNIKNFMDYEGYGDDETFDAHDENGKHIFISRDDVAWERVFDHADFDGQLAYQILELKDGSLLFGDYVGD